MSGPPDAAAATRAQDRRRAEALVHVSRETWAELETFVELLERWQSKTNLVAAATLPIIWTRHVADSLQLLPLIATESQVLVDLGSGGGFPAIPLACALRNRPSFHIHLVESVQRKAAFLREAIRLLHLPATVHNVRIEDLSATRIGRVDVVTARALAPLSELFRYVAPLLGVQTRGLLQKGRDVAVELEEAAIYWDYQAELIPSVTEAQAMIVQVSALAPRRRMP